jgi:uncharacterized membrane protein YhaH (DUF805 family)
MNWYITCIKKYADFNGRARRAEYWNFYLVNALIIVALYVLMAITGGLEYSYSDYGFGTGFFAIITYIYALFIILPGWAAGVRRLHDTGKSGWFLLVSLIPLVGSIWLIVMLAEDSQPGVNQYGPNPKV